MKSRIRGIFAVKCPLTIVFAITIAATVMLRPSSANSVGDYVRIGSLQGAGFYYVPGTDTCVNIATNDAREQTAGGTWRWRIPNNPQTWVPAPKNACEDGKLVKFGDITGGDLTLNPFSRFETNTHFPLNLKDGPYIASVLYKGGFTTTESLVSALPACPSSYTVVYYANASACPPGHTPVDGA